MKYLDLTLPDPAANLALEEALLDACEAGPGDEVLRLWQPATTFVAVGYGNHVGREVDVAACQRRGVPILRRTSGGGAVVQGPGVLCYAVVLRVDRDPALAGITSTNRYVMERVADATGRVLHRPVELAGDTDLVVAGRKFAGNAQRRKRRALLFHGSLLLNADLGLLGQLLPMPSRQPGYRASRTHDEFLTNLRVSPHLLAQALREVWQADEPLEHWPAVEVASKYSRDDWNRRW